LAKHDLVVLGEQVSDRVVHQVHQTEAASYPRGGHVADSHLDAIRRVLGSKAVGHAGRQLDPRYLPTTIGERDSAPACPDRELERFAIADELGEQVDGRMPRGRLTISLLSRTSRSVTCGCRSTLRARIMR
jgi:hypothetical protein